MRFDDSAERRICTFNRSACREYGQKGNRSFFVLWGVLFPELTSLPTAAPTLGQRTRHLLPQPCALHRFRLHLADVTSASFSKRHHQKRTNMYQSKFQRRLDTCFLTAKEIQPVTRLSKSRDGLTSAPRAWWLDITKKLSTASKSSLSSSVYQKYHQAKNRSANKSLLRWCVRKKGEAELTGIRV